MAIKPETIQKRIEAWTRKKAIYDRHLAGETYPAIARSLGVPLHNVMRHVGDWRGVMEGYPRYLERRDSYTPYQRNSADRRYLPLVAAGLLGGCP